MPEELQKFGQWTLMPEDWQPEAKESESPKQDMQKFGEWTLMPKDWEPDNDIPQEEQKGEQGGYLDYLKEIPRVAGQFAKGVAGVPASIANFLHNLTPPLGLPPEHPALRGMSPEQIEESEQVGRRGAQEALPQALEEVFLKPETEIGQQAGEAAETLGSILFPTPGLGAAPLKSAAKIAGAGQLAKWGAKKVGFGEDAADKFKLGSMLLTSFGGAARPLKEASKLYEKTRELIPTSLKINATPIKSAIRAVEEEFSPHIMKNLGSQKVLNEVLGDLDSLVAGNTVSARELLTFKQRIPDAIKDARKYGKKALVPLYRISDKVTDVLRNSEDIPKAGRDALRTADGLYKGYHNMTKAVDFMKGALKTVKDTFGKTTLGILGYHAPVKGPLAIAGAAAPVAYTALATGWEVLTNPSIRNLYTKALVHAARDNKGAFLKEAGKLDRKIKDMGL